MSVSKAVRSSVQYDIDISLGLISSTNSDVKYRSTTESLMYLATRTGPDLCMVASAPGYYLEKPTKIKKQRQNTCSVIWVEQQIRKAY